MSTPPVGTDAAAPPPLAPGIRRARSLDRAEIDIVLREMRWGVLSTSVHDQPYAVPVVFGWDGQAFYVASGAGRKTRNLEENPRACLTIADVSNGGSRWRSVVATGPVEQVSGMSGLLRALVALRRQQSGGPSPTAQDVARLARATILRLVPDEVTGRAVAW